MTYKYNGRPILRMEEFDKIAEKILLRDQPEVFEKHKQVDIETLIETSNMQLDFQVLQPDIFGVTAFANTFYKVHDQNNVKYTHDIPLEKGTILINELLSQVDNGESRIRFTLGHEYSHQKLHPHYFEKRKEKGNEPMICFRTAIKDGKQESARTEEDWIEWQANKLAASILMPKSEVVLAWKNELQDRHLNEVLLPWEEKPLPLYQQLPSIIHTLASHFGVSKCAMRYRLEQFEFTASV